MKGPAIGVKDGVLFALDAAGNWTARCPLPSGRTRKITLKTDWAEDLLSGGGAKWIVKAGKKRGKKVEFRSEVVKQLERLRNECC